MKNLIKISNEVIEESNELLEYLEVEYLEDEETKLLHQEIKELKEQTKQFERHAKLISMASGIYGVLMLIKIIIIG